MLGWLYWNDEGELKTTKTRFWLHRLARIYPAHLLALFLLIFLKWNTLIDEGNSLTFLISSAMANGLLVQAWLPSWVPPWNWPAWTLSALVFLYLVMPYLIKTLGNMSNSAQRLLLWLMPIIAIVPTSIYVSLLFSGEPWSAELEIFFSNNPLFWIPWFTAGLLLSKLISVDEVVVKKPLLFLGVI